MTKEKLERLKKDLPADIYLRNTLIELIEVASYFPRPKTQNYNEMMRVYLDAVNRYCELVEREDMSEDDMIKMEGVIKYMSEQYGLPA